MSKRDHDSPHRELHRVLRRGDPAGEGGLAPSERDRIRRQILTAARTPARRWFPELRTAGYVVAGLAAVMAGWLALQNLPQGTGSLLPQLPTEQAPLVAQELPGEVLPDAVVEEPAAPVQVAAQPAEEPMVATEPVAPAVLPRAAPRQPRQMQFTTGTTRVIWTLDPHFDLGPSSTAEQGEIS